MTDNAKRRGSLAAPLTTLAQLALLNLLTFLCCIPVVTIGASLAAMHAVLLKIVRREEGYAGRMFFAAFRGNLRKATLLWLPFLLIFGAVAADFLMAAIDPALLPKGMTAVAAVVGLLSLFLMQFVFPLQAHFENTVRGTLSGAALLAAAHFPKTFLMAALGALPIYIGTRSILVLPLVLLFGLTAPGFAAAKLYDPIFKKLEENTL